MTTPRKPKQKKIRASDLPEPQPDLSDLLGALKNSASFNHERFPTKNLAFLKKDPAELVATIAAQVNSTATEPGERVRIAYDLLDAAESGRIGLLKDGSYWDGVQSYYWARARYKAERDLQAEIEMAPAFFTDENLESRMDFDRVMPILFGGKERKIKAAEKRARVERLVTFLHETSKTEGIAEKFFGRVGKAKTLKRVLHGVERSEAENLVAQWMEFGIPANSYPTLKHNFPWWWQSRVAEKNSRNRQGKTQKPLKSTDGRRGARTPTFFEALKKTT